jgi:hypothetical protein
VHCANCGDQTSEVRPCYFNSLDLLALEGDAYVCLACAKQLHAKSKYSNFITWIGLPCDRCSIPAAFDGPIPGLVEGVVCDQCEGITGLHDDLVGGNRGLWLCEPCFDQYHHGHKQKQLQPILDRLAREFRF